MGLKSGCMEVDWEGWGERVPGNLRGECWGGSRNDSGPAWGARACPLSVGTAIGEAGTLSHGLSTSTLHLWSRPCVKCTFSAFSV